MRTADPTIIRDDFIAALTEAEASLSSILGAGLGADTQRAAAEASFITLGVLAEGFLSDLVIAYINKKSAAFIKRIEGSFEVTLKDDKDEIAARGRTLMVVRSSKRHLTLTKIKQILNVERDNLSVVNDVDKLLEFAGLSLAAPYKARFTGLSAGDKAVLKAVRGIRNFLAHRSAGAHGRMKAALSGANLPAHLRRPKNAVNDVGSYLLAHTANGKRVLVYYSSMKALAHALCP